MPLEPHLTDYRTRGIEFLSTHPGLTVHFTSADLGHFTTMAVQATYDNRLALADAMLGRGQPNEPAFVLALREVMDAARGMGRKVDVVDGSMDIGVVGSAPAVAPMPAAG